MGKDYYKILGVSKDASEPDLKKAYKKLAMKWHPDKNPGNKEKAETMFKDVSEAYVVLSNPEKRKIYDQAGEEGVRNMGDFGGSGGAGQGPQIDPNEIFRHFFADDSDFMNSFFGGSGGGNQSFKVFTNMSGMPGMMRMGGFDEDMGTGRVPAQQQAAPKQWHRDLLLTLDELYTGCTKRLKVKKRVHTGGRVSEIERILEVPVKAGWKEGTKVTYAGEGDEMHGQPSDIVLVVRTKPHSEFRRDGNNLIKKVNISLSQALTGFSHNVKTLDGRSIPVNQTEIIQPGKKYTIANEGMPISKSPGKRGSLLLEYDVQFPRSLSQDQKNKIREALG
eukprot:Filipodium_phascolosomae@DN4460_c0_g1_i1.p1